MGIVASSLLHVVGRIQWKSDETQSVSAYEHNSSCTEVFPKEDLLLALTAANNDNYYYQYQEGMFGSL